MMKNISILLTVILASFAFCQCQKQEPVLDEINVTLSVNGESETKVSYTTDGQSLKPKWENGDTLHLVAENEGYLGTISLKEALVSPSATATFSGKVKAWTGTQNIHVYYLGTNPTINEGKVSCTLSIPSQDGTLGIDGTTGGIARTYGFLHGYTSKDASATVNLGSINLSSMISVAYFDLSVFKSTVTCTDGYKSATLDMANGTLTYKTVGDIKLNSPSGKYYMALIPGENQLLTFTDGTETARMINSMDFVAGKYYTLNEEGGPIPVGEATEYTIEDISDVTVTHEGGTKAITVKSYSKKASEATGKAAPWKFQYYDETTEPGQWVDGYPSYISGTTSGEGSTAGESVDAKVAAQTATTGSISPSGHEAIMRNNPYKENYDLSLFNPATGTACSRSTANCYMVNSPGSYKFPAVYGNAIKDGLTNDAAYTYKGTTTSESYVLQTFVNHADAAITKPWIKEQLGDGEYNAVLAWKDETDLDITDLTVAKESEGMFITFKVEKDNITPGNLVIALTKDGTVVWSWHIWFTDEDVSTSYQQLLFDGREEKIYYYFMPTNLGMIYTDNATGYYYAARPTKMRAISTKDASTSKEFYIYQEGYVYKMGQALGRSLVYQWGRKDPFPSGEGNHGGDGVDSKKVAKGAIYTPDLRTAKDDNAHTIGEAIQNFNVFYPGKVGGTEAECNTNQGDWCKELYVNRWDANNCTLICKTNDGEEGTKTIYDPCPVGYKIPHQKAFGKLATDGTGAFPYISSLSWDSETRSAKVTSYWEEVVGWIPISGYRGVYRESGGTDNFGYLYGCGVAYQGLSPYTTFYTTSTSKGATCGYFEYNSTNGMGSRTNYFKSIGGSVRPMVDKKQ